MILFLWVKDTKYRIKQLTYQNWVGLNHTELYTIGTQPIYRMHTIFLRYPVWNTKRITHHATTRTIKAYTCVIIFSSFPCRIVNWKSSWMIWIKENGNQNILGNTLLYIKNLKEMSKCFNWYLEKDLENLQWPILTAV